MLHCLAFTLPDKRRIPVRQQDSDWSDIHSRSLKCFFNSLYEEILLWLISLIHSLDSRAYKLTSSDYQALPLALNFIASGECLKEQKMLLHVEER
jgi:hypothetical protein